MEMDRLRHCAASEHEPPGAQEACAIPPSGTALESCLSAGHQRSRPLGRNGESPGVLAPLEIKEGVGFGAGAPGTRVGQARLLGDIAEAATDARLGRCTGYRFYIMLQVHIT